uniref:Serine aminopeptidase S33 domain-containing protein n=1 Tax=Araucaria cunninghamii TaxID=56994 RepID=A0A0D6QWH6_ARACU
MIEQFINFIIRPPRAEYSPEQYLWEKEFTLAGRKYCRQDLEITNERGHILKCSHYIPSPFPEDTTLPCVIYCHGNSGCRADANEAAVILLPSNITVFTLDFSGSGLSDGDYVSLGWHEKDDLKSAVSYLRNMKNISCIGLWGRSMGAVTSLLYGAEDPSIAGMVLDSPFSNLFDLMMELVDVYKIRLPKFTVKVAVQYMRRVIQRRAAFDIMDLNVTQIAPKTFIPALFGHATEDVFIQPHHSDIIFKSYAGDKNIIKFEGDHNSARPQFYYDSVSIFFYNVLRPPQVPTTGTSKADKYFELGALQLGNAVNETLLYEIITGLRMLETGAASSSSAPGTSDGSSVPLPNKALQQSDSSSEIEKVIVPEGTIEQNDVVIELGRDEMGSCSGQGKGNGQNDECSSYSSSDPESWGRCSSLGVSDEESSSLENFAPFPVNVNDEKANKIDTLKGSTAPKKVSRTEKLEALGQRVRLGIFKRIRHRHSRSM